MGHVRDRWTDPNPNGRRVKNSRWGKGRRWQARWTTDGREKSAAFPSKDAAEAHLARVEAGTYRPADPMTVAQMLARWEAAQIHHRDSTADSRGRSVRRIVRHLGDVQVSRLTRHDVQQMVNQWSDTLAPSTIKVSYSALTGAMGLALLDGVVEKSPLLGVKLPRVLPAKVVPLTTAQVAAIRDAMSPLFRSAVVVAAATGMRQGELRGLTWDRIDGRTVTVDRQMASAVGGTPVWGPPKSMASNRQVDMGEVAHTALEDWRERSAPNPWGLVWVTRWRWPVSRGGFSEVWRTATEDMDLPTNGWHGLRHFHASLLIASGQSPVMVAARLGHQSVTETLDHYAHLWGTDEAKAVAAVDAELAQFSTP